MTVALSATEFAPASQIRTAADDHERARILLQLPDTIIADYAEPLRLACVAAKFEAGCQFLFIRVSALSAVRDRSGRLPDKEANRLEQWRAHFAEFARMAG